MRAAMTLTSTSTSRMCGPSSTALPSRTSSRSCSRRCRGTSSTFASSTRVTSDDVDSRKASAHANSGAFSSPGAPGYMRAALTGPNFPSTTPKWITSRPPRWRANLGANAARPRHLVQIPAGVVASTSRIFRSSARCPCSHLRLRSASRIASSVSGCTDDLAVGLAFVPLDHPVNRLFAPPGTCEEILEEPCALGVALLDELRALRGPVDGWLRAFFELGLPTRRRLCGGSRLVDGTHCLLQHGSEAAAASGSRCGSSLHEETARPGPSGSSNRSTDRFA
jgi:hypothetical protein